MAGSAQPPASGRPVFHAVIDKVLEHTADTRSLFLRIENTAGAFGFVPGQFISVTIPLGEKGFVRPYSIASSPEDGQPLEICLNIVAQGQGSPWLFSRERGDRLEFTGPFGMFSLARPPAIETVFIAETTAIAPIRPMLRRALGGAHPRMTLHYAAPDTSHLLYYRDFEQMAADNGNFAYEPLIAAEPVSALHELIRQRYVEGDNGRDRHFYICGVGKPVTALRDLLRGSGYQRRAVEYEQW